jgi:hypothetical protein
MREVDGATLIARSLKQQGINHLFGVVGFPVTPFDEPPCLSGDPTPDRPRAWHFGRGENAIVATIGELPEGRKKATRCRLSAAAIAAANMAEQNPCDARRCPRPRRQL